MLRITIEGYSGEGKTQLLHAIGSILKRLDMKVTLNDDTQHNVDLMETEFHIAGREIIIETTLPKGNK